MTTVYLDARFALDLAVNYCLLACAARLDGGAVRRPRRGRGAGPGAAVGWPWRRDWGQAMGC